MDILELMKTRHSVRRYLAKDIESEKRSQLNELAEACNAESGLNIQITYDEPKCFNALLSKILTFRNCTNYISLVGKAADPDLEEKSGYYGEKLVLKAQELGLNTCWVGLTRGKPQAVIQDDEKLVIVIALGYGQNQGFAHKNKELSAISDVTDDLPEWYARGLEAAMLAPTAVNQQKFHISLQGDHARITADQASYGKVDLGIVRYHFDAASGRKSV